MRTHYAKRKCSVLKGKAQGAFIGFWTSCHAFFCTTLCPKPLQSLIKYPQQAFVHLAHPFSVFLIKFFERLLATRLDMLPLKNNSRQ